MFLIVLKSTFTIFFLNPVEPLQIARHDLPQPAKSRILLEMAADLEDLYEVYREQGLGDEVAEARGTKFATLRIV